MADNGQLKAAVFFGELGLFSKVQTDSLDITGTIGTMKAPTLTTTQRDALTAAVGMIIYNSTTATMQAYANGAWRNLGALG
jgi:hypothetical protein